MATYSSILAWRIPWTEEPSGLQSIRLQSWTRLSTHTMFYKPSSHRIWEDGGMKAGLRVSQGSPHLQPLPSKLTAPFAFSSNGPLRGLPETAWWRGAPSSYDALPGLQRPLHLLPRGKPRHRVCLTPGPLVLLDGGQGGAPGTCSQHPPGRHRPIPVASTPQFRNNFKVQTSTPSKPPPAQLLVFQPPREQSGLTASRVFLFSALP